MGLGNTFVVGVAGPESASDKKKGLAQRMDVRENVLLAKAACNINIATVVMHDSRQRV